MYGRGHDIDSKVLRRVVANRIRARVGTVFVRDRANMAHAMLNSRSAAARALNIDWDRDNEFQRENATSHGRESAGMISEESTNEEPKAFGEGDVHEDDDSLDNADGTLEASADRNEAEAEAEGTEPDSQRSGKSAPAAGGARRTG